MSRRLAGARRARPAGPGGRGADRHRARQGARLTYGESKVADPCEQREALPGEGFQATLQRIVLDGLDGQPASSTRRARSSSSPSTRAGPRRRVGPRDARARRPAPASSGGDQRRPGPRRHRPPRGPDHAGGRPARPARLAYPGRLHPGRPPRRHLRPALSDRFGLRRRTDGVRALAASLLALPFLGACGSGPRPSRHGHGPGRRVVGERLSRLRAALRGGCGL